MFPSIKQAFADLVNVVYPQVCHACQDYLVKGEVELCTRCISDLPLSKNDINPKGSFQNRLQGRVPVEFVLSFFKFSKKGKVQKILHTLKYKDRPELAVRLGQVFGMRVVLPSNCDIIVPVPLHKTRFNERMYNQSEQWAQGLGSSLGIPVNNKAVERRHKTKTQTKFSRATRWENVSDVFTVPDRSRIEGLRILLVDDVATTGATLESCASCLLRNGAKSVAIACIAVA